MTEEQRALAKRFLGPELQYDLEWGTVYARTVLAPASLSEIFEAIGGKEVLFPLATDNAIEIGFLKKAERNRGYIFFSEDGAGAFFWFYDEGWVVIGMPISEERFNKSDLVGDQVVYVKSLS